MTNKNLRKPFIVTAALAAVASGVGSYAWLDGQRAPALEVYIFSLKSGTSILIRTPEDRRILIGGGATGEVVRSVSSILPFYSRHIDMLISPSDDDKVVTGLIDIADRYNIDEAYVPALTAQMLGSSSTTRVVGTSSSTYQIFLDTLSRKYIPTHEVSAGDSIMLGNNVIAQVLFPEPPGKFPYTKANPPELVLNITYRSHSILILGNTSKKIQDFLATTSLSHSDVVVVSGTALPTNTSYNLIHDIAPSTLVYSRAPMKSSPKKKLPPDPWAAVLPENRFNIREGRSVKVTSDGHNITTSYI